MSNNIDELKEAEKKAVEYDLNSDESLTHSQRARIRPRKNWGVGLVLIAIGTIFLIANLTDLPLNNWWALFILIPAFSNFGSAISQYRENGRLNRSARGSLTGGLILTLIASIFLFNLDWGIMWPFFLIILGLSALLGSQSD